MGKIYDVSDMIGTLPRNNRDYRARQSSQYEQMKRCLAAGNYGMIHLGSSGSNIESILVSLQYEGPGRKEQVQYCALQGSPDRIPSSSLIC